MRKFFVFIVASALATGTALAHRQGPKAHLADAPPDQQVEAITYCKGIYRVTTKKGSAIKFPEFNLRFKTDSSSLGPKSGTPVVIKAGMRGDRGFVVFSGHSEFGRFVKTKC